MLRLEFHKYKYGKELLIDCFNLSEIAGKTMSSNEVHATTFYEIFLFPEGSGSITLEKQKIDFKSPSVLLLRPSQPRKWDLQVLPDCMMLIFEGEFIEMFLKDSMFLSRLYYFGNYDCSPLLPIDKAGIERFKMLFNWIKLEIQNLAEDSQHLLRAYLYETLILLNRDFTAHNQLKGNLYRNTDMIKFKSLLKDCIREKQTVKEYAELLQMNRNRLNQLCQDAFGKDAHTLIRNELAQSCKHELLSTIKTIAEISYEYNFSAPSNFVRFFKSITGVSPAVYRNQYSNLNT
ncbi:AraC-type DNA-binding protein [Chitinophaga sp. YR573]|uniref:helix-turn-helix domain-containing protein n=1 Tax=Chitinophaga sp. YR573 TaxID=1881040 RepID=UPI0008CA3FFD|nr:helix-turn-helix transcriptional regulator [Chitinophaga sp. YR573]SEW28963.1 AraC-type DNA-binding protein [Chitinophaga sp. YR573]